MSYHFDVSIIGSVPLIHDFDDVDPTLAPIKTSRRRSEIRMRLNLNMHELIHKIRRIVVRPNSSRLFEINILHRLLISSWKAFVLHSVVRIVKVEVSMTHLHETGDPKYTAQIDTVGWIFIGFAVVITAIAAIVAYHGSEAMIANSPVSHVAGSPG